MALALSLMALALSLMALSLMALSLMALALSLMGPVSDGLALYLVAWHGSGTRKYYFPTCLVPGSYI